MRNRLLENISQGDKIKQIFYKQIYYMTLNSEVMKRKLYHKYDLKVLDNVNFIEFLRKINKFLSNYDPESPEFNKYVYGIYD